MKKGSIFITGSFIALCLFAASDLAYAEQVSSKPEKFQGCVSVKDVSDGQSSLSRISPAMSLIVIPRYPQEMLEQGASAALHVEFVVAADGTLGEVRFPEDLPSAFVDATRVAMAEWRYRPGTHRGIPVSANGRVLVTFWDCDAQAAEPGATDNPDDAQRLREDH